jgi:hypothetical protein
MQKTPKNLIIRYNISNRMKCQVFLLQDSADVPRLDDLRTFWVGNTQQANQATKGFLAGF